MPGVDDRTALGLRRILECSSLDNLEGTSEAGDLAVRLEIRCSWSDDCALDADIQDCLLPRFALFVRLSVESVLNQGVDRKKAGQSASLIHPKEVSK